MHDEENIDELTSLQLELQGVKRNYSDCGCDWMRDEIESLKEQIRNLKNYSPHD